MKKTYIQPTMAEESEMEMDAMICSSRGVTSDNGISYGGIDENGDKVPSARRNYDWDTEEDEEEW